MKAGKGGWRLLLLPWAPILLVAAGGAALIAYSTDIFPWAYSDSVAYIAAARNFARGEGLGLMTASGRFQLMTHFPPLYSLVLSIPAVFGADVLSAARGLDIFLIFTCVVVLAGTCVHFLGSGSLAIAVSVLTVTSPVLTHLFSGAVSEPLFLLLSFLSIALVVEASRTKRWGPLMAGASLAGLAMLTRYAGLTLLMSGPLIVLLLFSEPVPQRLRRALGFVTVGALPPLAWLVMIQLSPDSEGPRQLAHSVSSLWGRLQGFRVATVESLWSMIPLTDRMPVFPYRAKMAVMVGAAILMAFGLFRSLVRGRRTAEPARPGLGTTWLLSLLLFAGSYVLGLAAASGFTSPPPDIDSRILSPLLAPIWILLMGFITGVGPARSTIRMMVALAMASAVVIANTPMALAQAVRLHADGEGYTSRAWISSGVIEEVRHLPEGLALISNDSPAILLLVDRPAYDIPELITQEAKDAFLPFGSDPGDPVERRFRQEGAALVLFDNFRFQLQGIYPTRAVERLESFVEGLDVYVAPWDGAIYFYPGSPRSLFPNHEPAQAEGLAGVSHRRSWLASANR